MVFISFAQITMCVFQYVCIYVCSSSMGLHIYICVSPRRVSVCLKTLPSIHTLLVAEK